MAKYYAVVNADLGFKEPAVKDYKNPQTQKTVGSGTELIVDSKIYINSSGDKYLKASDGLYYLYYKKERAIKAITIETTQSSKVNTKCKNGLKVYKKKSTSSTVVYNKFKSGDSISITTNFITTDGNTWVYVSHIQSNSKVIRGWVLYREKGKNYNNITINGSISSVITNKKLDKDKIEKLSSSITVKTLFTTNKSSSKSSNSSNNTTSRSSNRTDNGSVHYFKGNAEVDVLGDSGGFDYKNTLSSDTGQPNFKNMVDDDTAKKAILVKGKQIIQNRSGFPKDLGFHTETTLNNEKINIGYHDYKYYMNYESNIDKNTGKSIITGIDTIRMIQNMNVEGVYNLYKQNLERYNRFKLAYPDEILSKSFAHVFFTRPDCRIYDGQGKLYSKVEKDPNFSYAYKHRPGLLNQITQKFTNFDHDFMMLLSNKAGGFSISDESLTNDIYGTTYSGYNIAFGRHNIASKASGEFSIDYQDNRDLDIFHIHKLWTDYISNVYKGKWSPRLTHINNKVLDYACSVYYILTAEDGETILFWSKYYGVFPLNAPSTAYSWSRGNTPSSPTLNVSYKYSFKEDFNPLSLVEFNLNSIKGDMQKVEYVPTYYPKKEKNGDILQNTANGGQNWVGAPFIETIAGTDKNSRSPSRGSCTFKLRFKK